MLEGSRGAGMSALGDQSLPRKQGDAELGR
jgi:hypothetical protein